MKGLLAQVTLKSCYYENRIFPIAAILKHKQVACVRSRLLYSNISLRSKDIQVVKMCKLVS